jgi:hypothetical protein
MKRNVRLAVAMVFLSGAAFAQSTYSTIYGSITDPSAAVIRDAIVQATNTSTGAVRSVKTNAEGLFSFVDLDPGTYNISATAANFAPEEEKGVELLAREPRRVDLRLQVAGATATTVEVTAQTPVSEQLTLSDSKSGDVINSLPLNFRATADPSPIGVATLAPGVQSDASGNITISGQLPTATSFSLDGISTQLPRQGGPTHDLLPSVEGIAEFRVNTASNSAEFAQPTDLTVISRGGTNDFHGGAFWYFQRESLNARVGIANLVPNGNANTFGASLGGPVVFPHIYDGKNKTFFYFDYEGVRLSTTSVIDTNTIPASWITGNFSGSGTTIVNPITGVPFANNIIPPALINHTSAYLIPYVFPAAINAENAITSPNLVQPFPGTYNNDGFDGRRFGVSRLSPRQSVGPGGSDGLSVECLDRSHHRLEHCAAGQLYRFSHLQSDLQSGSESNCAQHVRLCSTDRDARPATGIFELPQLPRGAYACQRTFRQV